MVVRIEKKQMMTGIRRKEKFEFTGLEDPNIKKY